MYLPLKGIYRSSPTLHPLSHVCSALEWLLQSGTYSGYRRRRLATNCNQRNYHPPYIHVVAPARRVLVRARQCGGDYMRDLPWMGREACEQEGTQNLPVRDYIARFTVGLLCGLNSRHTIVDVAENYPSLSDPILLPFWLRGAS